MARSAAKQLLTARKRPTAIFAASDVSAIETIGVARELSLEVPRDLSVVGFDNVPASALADPPLTTIDQSIQRMGREAVRLLLALIEHRQEDGNQHIVLPTRLVERASSASRPAGSRRRRATA